MRSPAENDLDTNTAKKKNTPIYFKLRANPSLFHNAFFCPETERELKWKQQTY